MTHFNSLLTMKDYCQITYLPFLDKYQPRNLNLTFWSLNLKYQQKEKEIKKGLQIQQLLRS